MSSITGQLAALATAFCWTVTALFFESAARRMGSLALNIIRLLMALVFLTVFNAAVRGRALPFDAGGDVWGWLTLSGLVGFTLGDMCLFRAYVLIGSRLTMLMLSLVPIFTALAGRFIIGETTSSSNALGMAMTILGIVIVLSERRNDENGVPLRTNRAGLLLSVGSAICQAVGLVLAKRGMAGYNPFAATQIRVMAGIAGFTIIYLAIGWWPRVFEGLRNRPAMSRAALGAFFGPFLGVSMSLLAVQHAKAGVAASIMSITPILIIAPAAIFFKEKVTPRAVIGALLAVGGVVVLFAMP